MSAFVVNRDHIRYLVSAVQSLSIVGRLNGSLTWIWNQNDETETYDRGELKPGDNAEASRVGGMLTIENVRSVMHRYPDTSLEKANLPGEVGDDYMYGKHVPWSYYATPDIFPEQVIMACRCYEYQACEHPGWRASEAHAFIKALERYAVSGLIRQYEDGVPRRAGKKELAWEVTLPQEVASAETRAA